MKVAVSIVIAIILFACSKPTEKKEVTDPAPLTVNDTTVYAWEITNELAGSAYRKRAKGYTLVAGNDTSAFKVYVEQAKSDGTVSIQLRFLKDKSNRKQMAEVAEIFPFAISDLSVNPDSLKSVSLGRLIECGDAAIDVAKQYEQRYGLTRAIDAKKVYDAILQSKLAEDWNNVLAPYGVKVKGVSAEKIFFIDGKDVSAYSKIESDSTSIPSRIPDCILWLRLGK